MLHGRDRDTVLARVASLRETLGQALGLAAVECRPLFSRRRFKQCGARYGSLARAA
jgi:hypothetical protein